MSKLDDFMGLLLGSFDNREQFEAKKAPESLSLLPDTSTPHVTTRF